MISPETTETKSSPKQYYLPFWTLYDYLDNTPPQPFIAVYVIDKYVRSAKSPEGPVKYEAVSLAIYKPDSELIAQDIPVTMLIEPDYIMEWSQKIAKWFTDQAIELVSEQAESTDEKG